MADKKYDEMRWEEKTMKTELRTSPSLMRLIDDWRREQEDLPTRSEAIRRLIVLGARAEKRR
jgi:hypothetical protein